MMLCGIHKIDIDDWKRNYHLKNYTASSKQVRLFVYNYALLCNCRSSGFGKLFASSLTMIKQNCFRLLLELVVFRMAALKNLLDQMDHKSLSSRKWEKTISCRDLIHGI